MSDLTKLLDSVVSIAKQDLAADVLPAVTSALPQLLVNPAAAGTSLLSALAVAGAKIAADEAQAVGDWVHTEVQKMVVAISPVATPPAAAEAPPAA